MLDYTTLVQRVQTRTLEEGECWVWQDHAKGGNLPLINLFIEGKWQAIPVRRAIKMAEGLRFWGRQHQARTTCKNPLCVNPEHIYVFNHKGSKGAKCNKHVRSPDQCARNTIAARKYKAKLNWDQVNEIRTRTEPAHVLAPIYGVSKTTINNIRAYKAWKVDATNPFSALFR